MIGGIAIFGGLVTEFNMNVSEIDRDGVSFYDKIPDSVKEKNLIFMIPGSKTGEKVLVPLAYGFGSAYTMGLSGAEVMDGQRSAEDGALFSAKSLITNFSPVYFSGTEKEVSKSKDPISAFGNATQNLALPDFVKPVVQSWQNVDAFGGEIVPEEKDGVSKSSQYYTSGIALRNATDLLNRWGGGSKNVSGSKLGVTTDYNPDLIEHVINSYGGGIATFLDRGTDAAFDIRTKMSAGETSAPPVDPNAPQSLTPTVQGGPSDDGFDFEKWPVVRRYYGKDFPYATYGNYYDAQEVVSAYIAEFSDPQELKRMKDEAMPSRDDLNEEDQKRYNGALAMKEVFSSVSSPLLGLNKTRKLLVTRQRDINAWVGSSKADIAEWNNLESKIKKIKEGEVKIMMEVMKQYYKFFPKPEE